MSWDLPHTQVQESDQRIQSSLAELGIPYEIGMDGDYRVQFDLANGKKQTGYLRSQTYDFEGIELRDIDSAAICSKAPFDAEVMDILLQENIRLKLGLWSVVVDEEGYHLVVYKVRVPASSHGQQLFAVISAVLRVASDMETRLARRVRH